jgi:hypothetical protein
MEQLSALLYTLRTLGQSRSRCFVLRSLLLWRKGAQADSALGDGYACRLGALT